MNIGFLALINNITYSMGDTPNYKAALKHGWQTHINAAEQGYDQSGFYGSSFVNHEHKQLILSYSGTTCFNLGWNWSKWYNCGQDAWANVQMYLGFQTIHHPDAQKFTETAISALKEEVGPEAIYQYNITLTGHSLGATIANLMAIDLYEKGLKPNIANFESPGSEPIVKNYIATTKTFIDIDNLDTLTYNGPSNWINSLNNEVGKVVQLKGMPYSDGSLWDGIMATIFCHGLPEILNVLVPDVSEYIEDISTTDSLNSSLYYHYPIDDTTS